METSYQWTVNSTTWNHLQAMWQAQTLDLLRLIHEETHHQTVLEASGYRSPTWHMAHLARTRRVILWESLRPEDQERCLTELLNDRSWVIWCKAKPKDMPAQSFREYGKCIFVGKCKKQKQADESQAESAGGRHVTRARGWWKRGDVAACAAQTNMHCWVHQDALFNDD